jgi:short-subunit dehydrogenase
MQECSIRPPEQQRAIVIGASSGIGRALAQVLAENGYAVGIAARRTELLLELQREIAGPSIVKQIDVSRPDEAMRLLEELIAEMGGADLIVINSGVGMRNPDLDWEPEKATIDVNVSGFVAMASVAMKHFIERGSGHLVGISSIAAIRGHGEVPAYGASKAFESSYLKSLRNKVMKLGLAITVTDIQPGFVDTAMIQNRRVFWVASTRKAALQIYRAIRNRRPHAYITRRWRVMAWVLKIIPERLWARIA